MGAISGLIAVYARGPYAPPGGYYLELTSVNLALGRALVIGRSNLPDRTVVLVAVDRGHYVSGLLGERFGSLGGTHVSVTRGRFLADFRISDEEWLGLVRKMVDLDPTLQSTKMNDYVEVRVVVTPGADSNYQPRSVYRRLGSDFRALVGSPNAEPFGDRWVLSLKQRVPLPLQP